MMADRLGPLVIKMRKTTTVICLVLINSMLASSQNETSNYRKIIKNTDWLINSHTINDSFVKNLNEIFFSFNDSNYFWLKTENNLLGTIKDTNALSGGNWHIDSNNLLVLESHLENRMWFQLAQRFWTYKISYISKDTIKLVPITHPFVEMLLTRVPKLKYSKPKFDRSEQFIWPPSISYWNLNQKHLKIISKSDKGRLKVPIGEIVTIWTIKEINTNLSARYTGNLFTCDSQNIYLKMNNKFQSWNNGDNIMTNITTEYPYSSDTVLYSSLRYSLIEKIPYKNIYSMEYGRISPEFSSATLIVSLLSLTSSLIIAPLISYNFKSGNFNQKRYYKIVIPSLITVAVSLPLTIFTINHEDRYLKNENNNLVFKPLK